MRRVILYLIAIVFLLGCRQDTLTSRMFKEDRVYQESIRYTQKGDIINSLQTKAIIIATYLNSLYDNSDMRYENFLVGVYTNDNMDSNYGLNSQTTLKLNLKEPLSVVEANISNYNVVFLNNWFKYYLVKFEKSRELNLEFGYKDFDKVELKFKKE